MSNTYQELVALIDELLAVPPRKVDHESSYDSVYAEAEAKGYNLMRTKMRRVIGKKYRV